MQPLCDSEEVITEYDPVIGSEALGIYEEWGWDGCSNGMSPSLEIVLPVEGTRSVGTPQDQLASLL